MSMDDMTIFVIKTQSLRIILHNAFIHINKVIILNLDYLFVN